MMHTELRGVHTFTECLVCRKRITANKSKQLGVCGACQRRKTMRTIQKALAKKGYTYERISGRKRVIDL